MINLYDSNEMNFNHNGLVVLSDCKVAFVDEELNGKYEAELEYPIDARSKWQYLTEGNMIKTDGQLFRIYNKVKTLAGIRVSARHIFYDLLDNFIESCSVGNMNAAGALGALLSNTQYAHGYTSMSDINEADTYEIDKINPVEAIMGSDGVISRYGGELVRDNFTIRLYQARGIDRGVLVSYGKNVIGIEETINMDSVCTRLLPVGKDGLLLTEKYLDSELINNYPHPIVKSIEFTDCETEDELREAGQSYLNATDKPLVNYTVDFIELTKTVEYKHYAILETVFMGDTVTIRHTKLGIDIKAKVIRIKKNLLTNRIEEVELGSFKPNFATGINDVITVITDKQDKDKTDLQTAIDNATAQINNALGGYVIKQNGELLIMDTEDIATAVKVWRWNQGGLGYSGTGYNGPFRTAITADGHIVADFMDTGTLTASLIKTGTITSKTGKLSIGLDEEVLNIGGKIIYDGATGKVTFASDVILSWGNIGDIPPGLGDFDLGSNFTVIGETYIYTGTLIAQQINAVQGIRLGANASIDWNEIEAPTAEQVGAKDINWHPDIEDVSDLSGRLTHIDGLGIYTGTLTAQQIQAIAIETLTISGALNCGNTLQIGPPNEEGTCHINTATDGIRFQSHRGGSYTKIEDDGSVSFYAGDVCYAWIKPDGTTNLHSSGEGGGSGEFGFYPISFLVEEYVSRLLNEYKQRVFSYTLLSQLAAATMHNVIYSAGGYYLAWVGDTHLGPMTEDFESSVYKFSLDGHTDPTTDPISWTKTTAEHHSGTTCLQSGVIGNSASSWLTVKASTTPLCVVSYWAKTSCAVGDYLRVYGDNDIEIPELAVTGLTDWTQYTTTITNGQKLSFRYQKDSITGIPGADAVYIDDITYADVVTREFQSDGYAILPPIDISSYTVFENDAFVVDTIGQNISVSTNAGASWDTLSSSDKTFDLTTSNSGNILVKLTFHSDVSVSNNFQTAAIEGYIPELLLGDIKTPITLKFTAG